MFVCDLYEVIFHQVTLVTEINIMKTNVFISP